MKNIKNMKNIETVSLEQSNNNEQTNMNLTIKGDVPSTIIISYVDENGKRSNSIILRKTKDSGVKLSYNTVIPTNDNISGTIQKTNQESIEEIVHKQVHGQVHGQVHDQVNNQVNKHNFTQELTENEDSNDTSNEAIQSLELYERKRQTSPVRLFINLVKKGRFEIEHQKGKISVKNLFHYFLEWCNDNGYKWTKNRLYFKKDV